MPRFEVQLYEVLNYLKANLRVQPLYLGGVASISGGAGGPPGGFIGYLPQTRVAYDSGEIASSGTPESGMSLIDNLNHIRYRIESLESGTSGIYSVLDNGVLVSDEITALDFNTGLSVTLSGTTAVIDSTATLETILLVTAGISTVSYEFSATGLQSALDDAVEGDVVYIPAGSLTGDFTIVDKGITVKGVNREKTIITGTLSITSTTTETYKVYIEDLTVTKTADSATLIYNVYCQPFDYSGTIYLYITDCYFYVYNYNSGGSNSANILLDTGETNGSSICYLTGSYLRSNKAYDGTNYASVILTYYDTLYAKQCYFQILGDAVKKLDSYADYTLFNCEFSSNLSTPAIKAVSDVSLSDNSIWYIANNLEVAVGDSHASDIFDGTPQVHVPLPTTYGLSLYGDGSKWATIPSGLFYVDNSANSIYFGGQTNGIKVTTSGDFSLLGNSTVFVDLLHELVGQKLESPASDIVSNVGEGSLEFSEDCTLSDIVIMDIQMQHDWKLGSTVYPHLHWWQTSATMPNWLIQYRWQVNGQAKTTAWSNMKWESNAFTYSAGTLNQITIFGTAGIAHPGSAGLSDILQVKLIRDTDNDSTEFTGVDGLAATISAVSFDIHYEKDSMGSRQEYVK